MSPHRRGAVTIVAALLGATALQCAARAQRDSTPPLLTGTFEISWFSIDVSARKPSVARLLLVISPQILPESLSARMEPAINMSHKGPPRACWRMVSGRAVMRRASRKVTATDWDTVNADELAVRLWFDVDAGSSLRFKVKGDSLRGMIISSGHMGLPIQTLNDSVIGRRIGEPDARRCFA